MACPQPELHPWDQAILTIVRDGDVEAFGMLVDRYHGVLVRHLTYRTGDPHLAADLAQESFLDIYRHLDRVPADRPFAAWLFGVAQHHVRMVERRRRLHQFVSLDWLPETVAITNPALRRSDTSTRSCEADLIQQVLLELSLPLREALLLHGLAGFPAPDVASILGISLAAAERRISRAKLQFRDRYRTLNEGDGNDPTL